MMYTQNRTSFSARNSALTNDDLRQLAPSVFADRPWHAMSERYTFIPTITIVDKMRDEGFQPYKAVQSNTRIPGKGDFTKHMIRFRDVRNGETAILPQLGHLYPELILTNAHDGASAYKLDAGMFRLVCMNGLMVSQGNVSQINVRHTGNLADDVINASYEVVEQFPKVLESVEQFGQLQLTAPQQNAFATAALALRYEDNAPVTAQQIIRPTRNEDVKPTLWNTFNTVQERLVNGGVRSVNATGRRARTRAVNGISESSNLNKALWTLTEKMRELMN